MLGSSVYLKEEPKGQQSKGGNLHGTLPECSDRKRDMMGREGPEIQVLSY